MRYRSALTLTIVNLDNPGISPSRANRPLLPPVWA